MQESEYSVFCDIGEGTRNVHLDWFGNENVSSIIDGYREAAKFVVRGAASDTSHPDMYFRPVAFLLRHAIELLLKSILMYGSQLHNDESKTVRQTHNLAQLWKDARSILVRTWPTGNQKKLDWLEAIINELHEVDPRGDAFRYATAKDGGVHLSSIKERVFSLSKFCQEVDKACVFLDGALMGIQHFLDNLREAQNDS